MTSYSFIKAFNADRLSKEIVAAGIPGFLHITAVGEAVSIAFSGALTEEQHDLLSEVVAQHQSLIPEDIITAKIEKAMAFGKQLMVEYATKNVKSGKTVAEVKAILQKCQFLVAALTSGSLYVALDEVENMEPDDIVSQEDKDEFSAKIREYLGL